MKVAQNLCTPAFRRGLHVINTGTLKLFLIELKNGILKQIKIKEGTSYS
jgi:hypothetical protein